MCRRPSSPGRSDGVSGDRRDAPVSRRATARGADRSSGVRRGQRLADARRTAGRRARRGRRRHSAARCGPSSHDAYATASRPSTSIGCDAATTSTSGWWARSAPRPSSTAGARSRGGAARRVEGLVEHFSLGRGAVGAGGAAAPARARSRRGRDQAESLGDPTLIVHRTRRLGADASGGCPTPMSACCPRSSAAACTTSPTATTASPRASTSGDAAGRPPTRGHVRDLPARRPAPAGLPPPGQRPGPRRRRCCALLVDRLRGP